MRVCAAAFSRTCSVLQTYKLCEHYAIYFVHGVHHFMVIVLVYKMQILFAGACAGDIENFCATVKPGEGRLSECLTRQQDEEAKGNVEGVLIRLLLGLDRSITTGF